MSALAATPEPSLEPAIVKLAIGDVRLGPSMRERGVDPSHVAALAEVADRWPPIVVRRADRLVIDGQHRVAAAGQIGLRTLRAVWFDGSAEDSYLEFVRCNVTHGLPLTLAERRLAARRIMSSRPDLSDRRIAAVCGLSPRTVARLREEEADTARPNENRGRTRRVGRDGRVRPLDPAATRARIAAELARSPDASLRAIASAVGASPGTVRSVRNQMPAGTPSALPEETKEPEATVLGLLSRTPKAAATLQCREDRAFTDRDNGPKFVKWFDGTSVEESELWQYVEAVPLSRVYEVADEARRRADFWNEFAVAIEGRVRRRA